MSNLRPELATSNRTAIADDTALFLIRDAVARRDALAYGAIRRGGLFCAIGCVFEDNPKLVLNSTLIDEVATVNDSVGPESTPKQRWKKVDQWLRWKLRVLATTPPRKVR